MSALLAVMLAGLAASPNSSSFEGRYFNGQGDVEYIELLETAARMFWPDPEYQNLPMLYMPDWNGFVEGPTWNAWWIQNTYGPTYCALPFWTEPYTTWIQNSQDLWFDQMGDGKTVHHFVMWKGKEFNWVAPDGCLCDAARPGWIVHKQGDGKVEIHDWGMEFTAAGVVMQAELLLIQRDRAAIEKYLPKLERSANFIETRRDPKTNLFLAGAAGNLLAPSYAGWHKPDGTYDKAYLTGLSVNYIAGLTRLIELEKMVGRDEQATLYAERRELAIKGLPALTTDEGYFIKSMDPDGTKHGVYGADRHGYFETVCNHDAICFRVVDDAQANKIYDKIASIPGLRPYDLIITNYPSLDDTYEPQHGIWKFGHWVNGGHWSTCEARMIMGYYRLGKYDDARRSMKRILGFAKRFRMDNNLTNFGSEVYQPKQPINCVYDTWGVPAAMIRGLFEYIYTAGGLRIVPHIPPGITHLQQKFPIRFGKKRVYLEVVGNGPIKSAEVNGQDYRLKSRREVYLREERIPDIVHLRLICGETTSQPSEVVSVPYGPMTAPAVDLLEYAKVRLGDVATTQPQSAPSFERIKKLHSGLLATGLGNSYEACHARLVLEYAATVVHRRQMQQEGTLKPLAEAASQASADKSYVDTAEKLALGLQKVLDGYANSKDPDKRRAYEIWRETDKQ